MAKEFTHMVVWNHTGGSSAHLPFHSEEEARDFAKHNKDRWASHGIYSLTPVKGAEGSEEKQMEGKEPVKKPVPSADVVPVPKTKEEKK